MWPDRGRRGRTRLAPTEDAKYASPCGRTARSRTVSWACAKLNSLPRAGSRKAARPARSARRPWPWPAPCSTRRTAWPGWGLRAPWCGLALSDLHLLASADDPALRDRPVPDLLAERLPLLAPKAHMPPRMFSTHWPPCLGCAPPSLPRQLGPGSSRSGFAWAARPAWMPRPAPISTCCGAASTICPTAKKTCWAPP